MTAISLLSALCSSKYNFLLRSEWECNCSPFTASHFTLDSSSQLKKKLSQNYPRRTHHLLWMIKGKNKRGSERNFWKAVMNSMFKKYKIKTLDHMDAIRASHTSHYCALQQHIREAAWMHSKKLSQLKHSCLNHSTTASLKCLMQSASFCLWGG